MSDWIGIGFFVLLLFAAYFGIRVLANQKPKTSEEFEKRAAEGSSGLGASMNALHELMNPEAAKAKEVQMQMKDGRYGKKKREGKANDGNDTDES
jgi:hypothetical protein